MRDPYLYPNSDVLINKLNIRDFKQLQQSEKALYLHKSELPLPQGNFDYNHLKSIHKHFFGELYEWAGRERTIDISKGNSLFGNPQFIEKELNKIFFRLAQENFLQNLPKDIFIEKLSYYFNEINAAHPFREGNGRTLRAFCHLLSEQAGYKLDWTQANRETYIQASISGFNGENKAMEAVLSQICFETEHHIKTIHDLSKETKELISFYLEQETIFIEAVDQKIAYMGENAELQKEFCQLSTQARQSMLSVAEELAKREDFKSLHELISNEHQHEILDLQHISPDELRQKFTHQTLSAQETMSLFNKIHNNVAELHQAKTQALSREEEQGYSY